MNFLELIFTVCMIGNDTVCEDQHIAVDQQMSVATCATCALPTLARWSRENPGWTIVRWHCDYSSNRGQPVVASSSKPHALTISW
jgi:hypothetical protein